MKKTYVEAVKNLRKIIEKQDFMEQHRAKPSFFSRKGAKLSFPILMYIILSLSKRPAQLRLDRYFKRYNKIKKSAVSVVASSFFEARLKILPDAFTALNDRFIRWFYTKNLSLKRFYGFGVFGVDGSVFEIPAKRKLKDFFRYKSMNPDTTTVRACANVIYDVCNKMTICASLNKFTKSERTSFVEMLDSFKNLSLFTPAKSIFVFDRGFPSNELIEMLYKENFFFVFRAKTNSFSYLKNLDSDDVVVDYVSYDKKFHYKIRVITVRFDSGEVEWLITNIFDPSYGVPFFKELYFLRWGIEGNYNYLKNKLLIEDFQSTNLTALFQNFHATVLMANLTTLAAAEVTQIIGQNSDKSNKYQYQANMNYVIGSLFEDFVYLFSCPFRELKPWFAEFLDLASKRKVPIRPNRHVKRTNKMKNVDKFFFNYRNLL